MVFQQIWKESYIFLAIAIPNFWKTNLGLAFQFTKIQKNIFSGQRIYHVGHTSSEH
jgi:hypothetical protein